MGFNSSENKRNNKELQTMVFRLAIHTQLEESYFSRTFSERLSIVLYLIVGYSVSSENFIKTFLKKAFFDKSESLLISTCIIYFAALITIRISVTLLEYKGIYSSKGIRLYIFFMMIFQNLVFPLFITLSSQVVSNHMLLSHLKLHSRFEVGLCWIGIPVFLAYNFFQSLLKCSLPSRNSTSVVSIPVYLVHLFSLTVSQVVSGFMNNLPESASTSTRITLSLVSNAFIALALFLACFKKVYWCVQLNEVNIVWCVRVLIFKVVSEALGDRFKDIGLISIVLLQIVATRVFLDLSLLSLKIDVFDPEISSERLYLGMVLLDAYIEGGKVTADQRIENELQFYYNGLWKSALDSGKLKRNPNEGTSTLEKEQNVLMSNQRENSIRSRKSENLRRIICFLSSKRSRNFSNLKLESILKATEIFSYLRTIRNSHDLLRQSNSGSTLGAFEQFQLESLWEARLFVINRSRTMMENSETLPALDCLKYLEEAVQMSFVPEQLNYLDSQKTFNSLKWYEDLCSGIESLCKAQFNTFDLLQENSIQSSSLYRSLNLKTLAFRKKIHKTVEEISSQHPDKSDFYSYIYPTFIFYFSSLKYDIDSSDFYLTMYKKKLSGMLASSVLRRNRISNAGLEIDSVTVQVSLEKEALGSISNISLNYRDFLGMPPDARVVGKPIGMLIPGNLSSRHLKLMDSENGLKVMNLKREIFIQDFEGNLRQIELTLKMAPSIVEFVSAFALITFETKQIGPSLILDKEMNIISANSIFNKLIQRAQLKRNQNAEGPASTITLSHLSPRLSSQVQLLQRMSNYFSSLSPPPNSSNQDKSGADEEKILEKKVSQAVCEVVENNSMRGMYYNIGIKSLLFEAVRQEKIHARFQFETILDTEVIKVYISRKQSSGIPKQELELIKQNNKKRPYNVEDESASSTSVLETNKVNKDIEDGFGDYESDHIASMGRRNVGLGGDLKSSNYEGREGEVLYFSDALITVHEILQITAKRLFKVHEVGGYKQDVGRRENLIRGDMKTNEKESLIEEDSEIREIIDMIACVRLALEGELLEINTKTPTDNCKLENDFFKMKYDSEEGQELKAIPLKVPTIKSKKIETSQRQIHSEFGDNKIKLLKLKEAETRALRPKRRQDMEENRKTGDIDNKKKKKAMETISLVDQNAELERRLKLANNKFENMIINIASVKTISRLLMLFTVNHRLS